MTFLYWRFHWQLVPLYYLDLQEWKSFNIPGAGNSNHTEQYIYVATQSGAPPLVVGEATGIIVLEVTEESTKVIVAHGAPYKFPGKWDPTIYYGGYKYTGTPQYALETQSERIKASKAHGIPICVAKLEGSWELAEGPTVLANVWHPYDSIKDAYKGTRKFGGLSHASVTGNKRLCDLVRAGSSVVQVQVSANGARTPWVVRAAAMSAETCVLPLPECGIVISGREPIVFSSSDE